MTAADPFTRASPAYLRAVSLGYRAGAGFQVMPAHRWARLGRALIRAARWTFSQ